MDVRSMGNLQVNLKQIAGGIFENLKDFGDPEYDNTKVTLCDPCEDHECHEHATCVAMALDYMCVCQPGYRDDSVFQPGRKCVATSIQPNLSPTTGSNQQNKMCHLAQPDIYFLVDMSRTVTADDLASVISFIREFIKEFTVSDTDAQFGLATFAAKFKLIFGLNRFTNRGTILDWLLRIPNFTDLGKGTRIGEGLNGLIREIGNPVHGRRRNKPLHVILFVDGRSADPVSEPAGRLKSIARSIQIVGIGRGVDNNELESIVTAKDDVIRLGSFGQLLSEKNMVMKELTDNICPTDACPSFSSQDIVFLVDSSSNMISGENNFMDGVKGAISKLINDINPSENDVKIAIVTYDNLAVRIIEFEFSQRSRELRQRIDSRVLVSRTNSEQNLGKGLEKILEMAEQINTGGFRDLLLFENFDFETTPNIASSDLRKSGKLVIISEGTISDNDEAMKNINFLREKNIDIAAISLDEPWTTNWLEMVSDEKYFAYVDRDSVDLRVDIYNALSKIKVDFFYGGCDKDILSPSWLRIVNEDESSAEIIWEPMVGLDSYMLSMNTPEEGDFSIPISKEQSSYVIPNLTPGTQFDIGLSAVKKITDDLPLKSPTPQETTLWTRPMAPQITSDTTDEFSAKVELEPVDQETQVDLYRVSINQVSQETYDSDQVIDVRTYSPSEITGQGNEIVFSPESGINLEPDTEYEVQVVAIAGPKESTPAIHKIKTRSLDAPIPNNVQVTNVEPLAITVSWDTEPAVASNNIKIQSLDGVEIYESPDIYDDIFEDLLRREFLINEGLEPGTVYNLVMFSKNQFDKISEPTEPILFSTSKLIFQP